MTVFSVTSTSRHRNGLPMFYGFEVDEMSTLDELAGALRNGGLVVGTRWRVKRDDAGVTLFNGVEHALTSAEIASVQLLRGAESAARIED